MTRPGATIWARDRALPYYRFTIRTSPDVTTAVLLLVTGLAVSQLVVRARRLKVTAITDERYLALIHQAAALAPVGPVAGGGRGACAGAGRRSSCVDRAMASITGGTS
jgi:uncharacterized protein involved in response to NO